MTRTRILRVGLVLILGLIAGSEWHRVFGWDPIAVKILLSAVVPAIFAIALASRRRMGSGVTMVVSLVAMVWFVSVVVMHESFDRVLPAASAPNNLLHDLANGWSQILSLPLPIGNSTGLLVFPCVTIWLSVMLGAEIVARTRRPLFGVLPPLVAYVGSLFFGIGAPGPRLVPAGAFLGASLILAGTAERKVDTSTNSTSRRFQIRRGVSVGLAGCVAVALGVIAGPNLPFISSGHPYNPRTSRIPPSNAAQSLSPLVLIDEWSQGPSKPLFTVHSSTPLTTVLTVLGDYSPLVGWNDASHFERISTEVPSVASPFVGFAQPVASAKPIADTSVRASVSVGALPGPWLPVPAGTVSIHGVAALEDSQTGVVIASAGNAQDTHYSVSSRVPVGVANCSGYDVVPSSASPASAGIEQDAQEIIGTNSPPCAEAETLLGSFSSGTYKVNPRAPSGTNIQVIEHFLYGQQSSAKQGTSEQFAGAFALLAQSLGMQSRVAVGFHAGTETSLGTWQVGTRDAFAFAEVDFKGLGWVGFDPTPSQGSAIPADEPDKGQTSTSPGSGGKIPPAQKFALPTKASQQHGLSPIVLAGFALAAAVLAVILGALLVAGAIALFRWRRGRRRRAANGPRERILGAWKESVDHLRIVGVATSPAKTPEEIAHNASGRLGSTSKENLDRLAKMVNEALYSSSSFDDDFAEKALEAWRRADEVGAVARQATGMRDRLVRALDVRVLTRQG